MGQQYWDCLVAALGGMTVVRSIRCEQITYSVLRI